MLMKRHLFITRPHKSPRTRSSSTRNLDAADPQKTAPQQHFVRNMLRVLHGTIVTRYSIHVESPILICIFFKQVAME